MLIKKQGRRTASLFTAPALVVANVPGAGFGQGAPGPVAGDPPGRVGRLARVNGTVSYHLAGADRWEPASLNLPVTTGSAFWTEPGARADIGIAGDRLVLDQSTELDMVRLDDRTEAATLPQGAVYWHERGPEQGGSATVQTPRGLVTLAKAGRYEVVAGDTQHPTTVTVVEGEADVSGAGVAVHVGPSQTAVITGDGTAAPFQAALGPAARDPFLTAMLAEEQPARRPAVAPPAYVAEMTGGEALDEYGEWASAADYGPIWYPPAETGFVPYRHGHWAYVQPWGWTWVDEAPWGFAPSHYGRWVQVSDRWGWIPGIAGEAAGPGYPVYAPAVVSFLAGAAVGALAAGSVGWVPLGPREPYFPPYRVSQNYVRQVNIRNVTNVATVVNNYGRRPGNGVPMINRNGASLVPAAAMASSQNLGTIARDVPHGATPRIATLQGPPPLRPTMATAGVTPLVARQLSIVNQGPGRPHGPGPAIRMVGAAPGRPRGGFNGGAPATMLGGARAGGVVALQPSAPGMPGLRAPGDRPGLPPREGGPGPAITERAAVPEGPRLGQPQAAWIAPPRAIRPPTEQRPAQALRPSSSRPQPQMARPEARDPMIGRAPLPAAHPAPPPQRMAPPPHQLSPPARPGSPHGHENEAPERR